MRSVERISYLVVVVSNDMKWDMGGSNSLRWVVWCRSQRSLYRRGRWCRGVAGLGEGGCREGEDEEGMVCQREARYREVLDIWEEIQVG
jgi:hypothetical protein